MPQLHPLQIELWAEHYLLYGSKIFCLGQDQASLCNILGDF